MSVFSQRYGYSEDQGIQYECVGKRLRNRLWNHFFPAEYDADPFNRDDDSLTNIEYLMDGLGLTFNIPRSPTARAANAKKLKECVFDETKWYLIYDLIERYVGLFDKTTQRELCKEFNEVLEDECSGYRFVKGLITPITNKEEIKTIEKATNTKYSAVNTHISKALVLFSDRLKHDYENTIKESISAVEALCCIITNDKSATLGDALKKLESRGIKLHKALQNAMSSLYGYTSDEGGIRHGSIDFAGASSEDAKYMLISCSAFVNYLIEKWEKVK